VPILSDQLPQGNLEAEEMSEKDLREAGPLIDAFDIDVVRNSCCPTCCTSVFQIVIYVSSLTCCLLLALNCFFVLVLILYENNWRWQLDDANFLLRQRSCTVMVFDASVLRVVRL
jgi:hypothetical protein